MGLAVGGVEGRAVWWEKMSREKELRDRRLEGWVRSENYGSMAGGEFSGKRNGRGKSEGGGGVLPAAFFARSPAPTSWSLLCPRPIDLSGGCGEVSDDVTLNPLLPCSSPQPLLPPQWAG